VRADRLEEGGGLTEDIAPLEPSLARGIQANVIHTIGIAFGEDLHLPVLLLVDLQHAMDDGDVSVLDLEHDDLTHTDGVIVVGEEEDISSLEGGHHGATARGGREGEAELRGAGQKEREGRVDLKTTTTGDSERVRNIRPFQIMRAENTIIAKTVRRARKRRLGERTEVQCLKGESSFIFPELFQFHILSENET
jgi:hypothetical protein